jgi:hypothetical protein
LIALERLQCSAPLFCLAYPRQTLLVCLVVIGSAVLLGVAQLLTPDRHGRVLDAVEKIAGGALGILIGQLIFYLDRSSGWFRN